MPGSASSRASTDVEAPLPRPTVVAGSRPSSRASSIARSAYSAASPGSRSTSPAQLPQLTPRNRSSDSSRTSSLGSARSASRGASASTSSTQNHLRPPQQLYSNAAATYDNVVEVSSDSSDDEDIIPVAARLVHSPQLHPVSNDFFEVSGVRRAPPTIPARRSDLFSPPPLLGRPAEPLRLDSGGRLPGVSVDPNTGDFLTRPMPVVRPRTTTSHSDPDGSFSIISEQLAPAPQPPARSEHPITDQRLRSTNLAMPTKSPPRTKPPPIEHPLLSKYNCAICFDAPKDLCVTPCGHLFCGDCLFQALKTQAVQRGAAQEEEFLFNFGGLFAPFASPGTFGAGTGGPANVGDGGAGDPDNGSNDGRGGTAAAGRGRGRGGARGGAAGTGAVPRRKGPDPLAGQCPVCRAKIKGAFNGREKMGILGLRLTIGKPVDDPREENGKLKGDPISEDAGSIESSQTSDDDEEALLPTGKPQRKLSADVSTAEEEPTEPFTPHITLQRRRRSSIGSIGSSDRPLQRRKGATDSSRRSTERLFRRSSDSSATQTEPNSPL